jgi:hypothetical protein
MKAIIIEMIILINQFYSSISPNLHILHYFLVYLYYALQFICPFLIIMLLRLYPLYPSLFQLTLLFFLIIWEQFIMLSRYDEMED